MTCNPARAINYYAPLVNPDASNYVWTLLVVVPTVVAGARIGTYVRRRKRKEKSARGVLSVDGEKLVAGPIMG